jgi:hypothetical protein
LPDISAIPVPRLNVGFGEQATIEIVELETRHLAVRGRLAVPAKNVMPQVAKNPPNEVDSWMMLRVSIAD